MTIIFVRTILVYSLLLILMRLMGKRQLGQLEITDFITTLLISEIASMPIENPDTPIVNAIVPMIAISTFEIVSSFILSKSPKLKNILSCRPDFLIKDGVINQKEMIKSRISIDELFSEIRKNNILDISEVEFAIIEQDSKLTIIPKAEYRVPCFKDLGIKASGCEFSHIIISNGCINKHGLISVCKDEAWLGSVMEENMCKEKDIFLMTLTNSGKMNIILKEK